MIVLPVIDRELRVQARLGFTFVLRVLGAAALLLVCFYFWARYGFSPRYGGVLFSLLDGVLFLSIWVLVPLLAADCISRERREGTLGLLFLTPLTAREIVLSKGLVHGLRALTLWLAVLPILTICFLLGGVTWKEAVLSALVNFSSICWALAAGLLASSMTKTWLRAMLLAGGLAVCLLFGFIAVTGLITWLATWGDSAFQLPFPFPNYSNYGGNPNATDLSERILGAGFFTATGADGWWGQMFGALTRPSQRKWLLAEAGMTVGSILFLLAVSMMAALNLRRSWQEEPPSARQVWLQEKFCTPIIGVGFFRRWLGRKLERNPIGWLEQRTWSGRLVTWGWFAVMVSFYSAVFYVPSSQLLLATLQNFMAWSLLGLVAVSAAGSFQRERESRVLELLLVSPMSEGEIIMGRLRGLWGQFLPALALMLGVWIYLAEIFRARGNLGLIPFFCGGYATLPVIGLYYSLRRTNFMNAFVSTVFVGLLLPYIVRQMLVLNWNFVFSVNLSVMAGDALRATHVRGTHSILSWGHFFLLQFLASSALLVTLQAGIASWIGWRLHRDLVRRNFPFSKSGT